MTEIKDHRERITSDFAECPRALSPRVIVADRIP